MARRPAPVGWVEIALCAVLLGMAAAAHAEGERASCSATLAGGRVLVDPVLERFFDPELIRLVRLGLVGRVHLEVTLKKRRSLWFDGRIDRQEIDFTILWSQARARFLIEDRREVDPARILAERLVLHPGDARDGPLSVSVDARLQVITASSLGTVAGWMVESDRPAVMPAVLNALANDLSRSASGECEVRR